MQAYDDKNIIVDSGIVEKFESLEGVINRPKIKKVVIGKIPLRGSIITINGLAYVVIMANEKKKRMTLQLM